MGIPRLVASFNLFSSDILCRLRSMKGVAVGEGVLGAAGTEGEE